MSRFVAEVKIHSPFGFHSEHSWDELFDLANQHGDVISIHTDPRWHGSFDLLKAACKATKKPVLAKGIHDKDEDVRKALNCGAAYVLVVGRIPEDLGLPSEKLWLEMPTLMQLEQVPSSITAVWNQRNLKTGHPNTAHWHSARQIFRGNLVQASYIRSPSDVQPDSYAHIVGTHLKEYIQNRVQT